MKRKKIIKENFYLLLLAALIGFIFNYLVTSRVYAEKHHRDPNRILTPILHVFDLPTHS